MINTQLTIILLAGGVITAILLVLLVFYLRLKKRLRLQTDFWNSFLEKTTVGIMLISPDRNIIELNPRLCEIFGYSREELIGKNTAILHIDQESYTKLGQWFKNTNLNGKIAQIEYRFRRKDGSLFWTVISGGSLLLPNGADGVVCNLTDISDRKRIEEQLLAERSHLQTIFEVNGSGMLIVSAARQILQVNSQFCTMFGYRRDELVGQSALILHLDQQHFEDWAPCYQEAQAGRQMCRAEYPWRRKDGSVFWCYFAGVRMQLLNGEYGVLWNVIDITDWKNTEKQMFLMNLALDTVHEAAYLSDNSSRFFYVNQEACLVGGYSKEELLTKKVEDIDRDFNSNEWPEMLQKLLKHKKLTLERYHTSKDAKRYPVEVSVNLFTFDGKDYVLGLARNITERRKTEAVLKEAKERAEQANHAKTEFLANMSHEIRTPMNGIVSMTHLLKMTELNSEQLEYLDSLEVSSRNLLELISDILDISKIESGKLELEISDFSIRQSIQELIASQISRIRQKNLKLVTSLEEDLPDMLVGDSLRFKQIVLNLLGNAIKFTEAGSIKIAVKMLSREGSLIKLRLVVSDTGIGMSKEVLDRVFIPFEQADSSTTRKYGGTGLGLSICRRLVELMGGRIWAVSKPGAGATFYTELSFLLQEAQSEPVSYKEKSQQGQGKSLSLSILLAEDNSVNAKSMSVILTRMGHRVVTAEDGQKAFENWLSDSFDCILMDVQMPVVDGIEAAGLIRQSEKAKKRHTPIIALTAHAMRGDRERLLAEGFDGYVSKPVDIQLLLAEIERLVGYKESGDEEQ